MEPTSLTISSRRGIDFDTVVELAKRADELGYDTLWMGESWGPDSFIALGMVACNTSNIKVGPGIVNVYSRTPGLIAQSAATLDLVSKGRAVLGLGASGRIVVEQWHGLKYEQPITRTREYIEIVRLALAGERVDYQGPHFNLKRFKLPFETLQERIPIYVASLGPKNLALTGELADGWLPIWVHPGHLETLMTPLTDGARKAGRDPSEVTVAPQVLCYITDGPEDRDHARRLLRSHMAYYIGGMGVYYHALFQRYGYVEESDRVKELWAQGDRESAAGQISDDMLDNITIYGDRDECRDKMARLRASGVDAPVVGFPNGSPREALFRTLEGLAPTL